MTTLEDIYNRNAALNFVMKIEFKRRNGNGTYESSWTDVRDFFHYPVILDDSIPNINMQLPNSSYAFGVVEVPSCTIKFKSINKEFAKEDQYQSVFFGFIRHKTQVRISQGFKDEIIGTEYYEEVYRGFIDEQSTNTKVDKDNIYQFLQIEDMLTFLLKEHTYSEFTLTSLTLENFVYELMNNIEFTDFMTVNSGNIDAGYDIQHIYQIYSDGGDTITTWEGQTQILTILQELSTGHSIFYQRNGVFYYKPITGTSSVIKTFKKDKVVKFQNYSNNIDKVYENIYWGDTGIVFNAPNQKYGSRKTIEVEAVRDLTDRENMLATIGTRTAVQKAGYRLIVPVYPSVFILDKIKVETGLYNPLDGFILDQSRLDVDYLRDPQGASFIDDSTDWMIKNIKHNFKNCTTELILQQII